MDGGIAYLFRVALVALVTIGVLRVPPDQPQHLPECSLEGVSVKGIGMQRLDADHPIVPEGGDNRNLKAELVRLVGLAPGDSFHLGSMQAVEFIQ